MARYLSHLARAAQHLGLDIEARLPACIDYLQLLCECNRDRHLIATRDPWQLLDRHIIDSLTLLPHISGPLCLDIGSGAGLPGLVLALVQPEREWIVLDRARRKVQFLHRARMRLALDNVTVLQGRVQEHVPASGLSTLVCRALAPLPRLLALAGHLLGPGQRLLAMKGQGAAEEIAACTGLAFRFRCHALGANDSTLVEITAA